MERGKLQSLVAFLYTGHAARPDLHLACCSTAMERSVTTPPASEAGVDAAPLKSSVVTEVPVLIDEPPTPPAHQSFASIVLLGACAHFVNLAIGFSFNATAVTLDQVADDLDIVDKDLQWVFNSFFLAIVSGLCCKPVSDGKA